MRRKGLFRTQSEVRLESLPINVTVEDIFSLSGRGSFDVLSFFFRNTFQLRPRPLSAQLRYVPLGVGGPTRRGLRPLFGGRPRVIVLLCLLSLTLVLRLSSVRHNFVDRLDGSPGFGGKPFRTPGPLPVRQGLGRVVVGGRTRYSSGPVLVGCRG